MFESGFKSCSCCKAEPAGLAAPDTVKNGIGYWKGYAQACAVRDAAAQEFPAARVVRYLTGYAVQVRVSGDYLGRDFRPSMESRRRRLMSEVDFMASPPPIWGC
jgi:hypothetical protein